MNKTSLALIQRNISIHLPFLRKPMYIYSGRSPDFCISIPSRESSGFFIETFLRQFTVAGTVRDFRPIPFSSVFRQNQNKFANL